MRVKHLDELYTWKQIRKLQIVHNFNLGHDFVPIALFAPDGGRESHYGGADAHYQWYGKQSLHYAKKLWEAARQSLASLEAEALAFESVAASECFHTIRFINPEKAQNYRAEFLRLARKLAERGSVKSAIGRAPARPYPWDATQRYEEIIIADGAPYEPFKSHDPKFDSSIANYQELPPLPWGAVEKYFVELTESELAFLNGASFVNKPPSALDSELLDACARLDVQSIEAALNAGANPNAITAGPFADTAMTKAFADAPELQATNPEMTNLKDVINLLLLHGGDINLCAYEAPNPLYEAIHFDLAHLQFVLKKGGDPQAICWIGRDEIPSTAFDHVCDDITILGESPELNAAYELLNNAGGRFFSDIAPAFYEI